MVHCTRQVVDLERLAAGLRRRRRDRGAGGAEARVSPHCATRQPPPLLLSTRRSGGREAASSSSHGDRPSARPSSTGCSPRGSSPTPQTPSWPLLPLPCARPPSREAALHRYGRDQATFLYAKTAVTTLRSATRLRSHGCGLWLGVKETLLTRAGPVSRSTLERRALCSSPASGVSLYLWL